MVDNFPLESPKFSVIKDGSCVKGNGDYTGCDCFSRHIAIVKIMNKIRAKIVFNICYSAGVGGLF